VEFRASTGPLLPPHLAGSRSEALSAQFSITRAAFSSRPSTVPQAQRWTRCARGFRSCRPQAEQVWDRFTVRVGTLSQASPASSAFARSMWRSSAGDAEDLEIPALLPGIALGRHALHREDLSGDESEHAHQGGGSPCARSCRRLAIFSGRAWTR